MLSRAHLFIIIILLSIMYQKQNKKSGYITLRKLYK